jgi:hypothetical protein
VKATRKERIDSTTPSWDFGAPVASPLSAARGGFGVNRITLAAPTPILAVLTIDLDHFNTLAREVFEQTRTVRAGALDADAQKMAVAAQEREQLAIAGVRGLEVANVKDLAPFVDHRRDVDVLVGVDAVNDDALII